MRDLQDKDGYDQVCMSIEVLRTNKQNKY